jgi:uncharacterized protein YdeI (YjbR/CyaY-like superfamily)
MKARFFRTAADFRAWLEKHHGTARELVVGFYKKGSGKPSVTWSEAVDQALCFGWIDSIRRRIDDVSYSNRFTPRRAGSNWSAVNIQRVRELSKLGLMTPSGLKAFEGRRRDRSATYSYERRKEARLEAAQERRFRANRVAWTYFQSRPPSYRQTAIWWVVSAKQEATRERRLARLIEDSANGRPIPPLAPSR